MRRWFKRSAGKEPQKAPKTGKPLSDKGKAWILYAIAAITILIAFAMPVYAPIGDWLFITVLCMAIILPVFAMRAKDPSEIATFPLILTFVGLLRLFCNIYVAKAIILSAGTGFLVKSAGNAYKGPWSYWALLIIVLTCCSLAWKTAITLLKKSKYFLLEVLPIRRELLESQQTSAGFNSEPLKLAGKKIEQHAKFYIGMAGMAKFQICDTVIAMGTLVVTTLSSALIGKVSDQGVGPYIQATMGMGLVSFAPILVTAILTQVITIKRFFKLDNSKPAEPVQPKIQVQSREVKQSGDEKAQELVQESTEAEQVENDAAIEPEHVVEAEFDSEPEVSESLSEEFFDLNSNSDTATAIKAAIETKIESSLKTDAEFEYERITALIHDEKCRLLLAGANTVELGVNYPINIGIRLGQAGKKCILLDADNRRNAIAKAFDLDPESVGGRAVKSGIEGLWVSSVKTEAPTISLAKLVKNATKLFDCVVIYAPNLSKESEIGNIADKAVVFGSPAEPEVSAMVQAFKNSCQNVVVIEEMVKPATEVA